MSYRKKALAGITLVGSLLLSACTAEDVQAALSGFEDGIASAAESEHNGQPEEVRDDEGTPFEIDVQAGEVDQSRFDGTDWALSGKPLTNGDKFNGSVVDSYSHLFEGREIMEVDICDTSGKRKPNAAVHIGATDNRDYWGFTNEHGQLVYVVGAKIIVQDDATEDVNSSGRYCSKMADVEGVGKKYGRDRGHVIADSLGGVSNAYNITPQDAHLNRHGDQAYMEDVIRKAGGADQFEAIVTYPDTTTQVPDEYIYRYTVAGNRVMDHLPNGS